MPNLDAANIAYQLTKVMADALPVGPILIGPAKAAHVVTPRSRRGRHRQHDGRWPSWRPGGALTPPA